MASSRNNKDKYLLIRSCIAAGMDEKSIIEETGLPADEVERLISDVMTTEQVRVLGTSPEVHFTRYALQTEDSLQRLDEIVSKTWKQQPAAAVGALKTKQTIYRDMVVLGQSLGLVKKQADVRINVLVNSTSEDLRKYLEEKMSNAQRLASNSSVNFLDDDDDDRHPLSKGLPMKRVEATVSPAARQVAVDDVDVEDRPVVRRRAAPV